MSFFCSGRPDKNQRFSLNPYIYVCISRELYLCYIYIFKMNFSCHRFYSVCTKLTRMLSKTICQIFNLINHFMCIIQASNNACRYAFLTLHLFGLANICDKHIPKLTNTLILETNRVDFKCPRRYI